MSYPYLEFLKLVLPEAILRDEEARRVKGGIEGGGSFRDIRHLPVVLADIGAGAMPVVNLTQGEDEDAVAKREPSCGRFFLSLVRRVTQAKMHPLSRRGLG